MQMLRAEQQAELLCSEIAREPESPHRLRVADVSSLTVEGRGRAQADGAKEACLEPAIPANARQPG